MIKKSKIVWVCDYPLNVISQEYVNYDRTRRFHPASWLVHLSDAIAQNISNIELHIVTVTPWVKKTQSCFYKNIHFHILRSSSAVPFSTRGLPWSAPAFIRQFNVKKILAVIREIKPDLIHVHGTEGVYGLAAIRTRLPFLVSIQGIHKLYFDATNDRKLIPMIKHETSILKNTEYVGSRTQWADDYIRTVNPGALIFDMPEAINPVFFAQRNTRKTREQKLLYVGSIEPRKGVETLLKAFHEVRKHIPEVVLEIVGSGSDDYTNLIKKLTQDLNITDVVKFHGHLSPAEIKTIHEQSLAFIFPTYIDNSPNSVVEAMASGLPVIASRVGGLPSIIENGQNGLLVTPGDHFEIANKIILLCKNEMLAAAYGQKAREFALQRNDPETCALRTADIYDDIIRSNSGGEVRRDLLR